MDGAFFIIYLDGIPDVETESLQPFTGWRIPAFHAQDKEQRKGGGAAAAGSETFAGTDGMAGAAQAGSREPVDRPGEQFSQGSTGSI